ncbi:MAG: hypothetical protein KAW13_03585 [Dehalococcoidia bacterium]|nr:hypothetical protein [Dehalococcoidia bacterium]
MAKRGKFGARLYLMDTNMVLVVQTVKRGTAENAPYVIDQRPTSGKERFVSVTDDKGIADAIRDALEGRL